MEQPIKDKQGVVPTYIINGEYMVHQASGKRVQLKSRSPRAMREAQAELKGIVEGTWK